MQGDGETHSAAKPTRGVPFSITPNSSSIAPPFTEEEARTQEFCEVRMGVATERGPSLKLSGPAFRGQLSLPAGKHSQVSRSFLNVQEDKNSHLFSFTAKIKQNNARERLGIP